MTKLSSIADYVTDKISSNDIALREYVTTDCILQNRKYKLICNILIFSMLFPIIYMKRDKLGTKFIQK